MLVAGRLRTFLLSLFVGLVMMSSGYARTILFIGNSFTFGAGSPVMRYQPERVADLNGEGIGGEFLDTISQIANNECPRVLSFYCATSASSCEAGAGGSARAEGE